MPPKYQRLPGEQGSLKLISPDGKVSERFLEGSVERKLAEGWTVAPGQTVGMRTQYGEVYTTPEGMERWQAGGVDRPAEIIPAAQHQEAFEEEQRRQEYEGRVGSALAAGAARGLTFGLSDPILTGMGVVDPETLAGLQEFEPGASLAGELGAIVGGGIGAAGRGLTGSVLRATPGGRAAAAVTKAGERGAGSFIAASAIESAAYGVGYNISQAAVHDEELTAEGMVSDALKAGVFGAVGAAAFAGGGKLYSRAQQKFAAKPSPLFDVTTEEGGKFMTETSRRMNESLDFGDELMTKTDPNALRRVPADEAADLKQWEIYSAAHLDDVIARGSAMRKAEQELLDGLETPVVPAKVPDVEGHAAKIQRLEDELEVATKGSLEDFVNAKAARQEELMAEAERIAVRDARIAAAPPWLQKQAHAMRGDTEHGVIRSADEVLAEATKIREEIALARQGKLGLSRTGAADEISAELKSLRKSKPEMVDDAASVSAYTKDLDAYEQAAASHKAVIEGIDDSLAELARHRSYMAQAKKAGAEFEVNDFTPEALIDLRRILGDPQEEIDSFTRVATDHIRLWNMANRRAKAPLPAGIEDARSAYAESLKLLEKSVGKTPTPGAVASAMNGSTDEVIDFGVAMTAHYKAVEDLAHLSGDTKLVEKAKESLETMAKHMSDSLPPAAKKAGEHIRLRDIVPEAMGTTVAFTSLEDGPFGDIVKAGAVFSLARKGLGVKAAQTGKRGFVTRMIGAGGAGTARGAVRGQGLIARGARGAAGMGGYLGTMGVVDRLADTRRIFAASGKATSMIGQAVDRMIKGTVKKSLGGAGAVAMLRAINLNEDGKREYRRSEEKLEDVFKKHSERLTSIAADPQRLAEAMHEATAPLRQANPTLGDKVEVKQAEILTYLLQRMPKDPGTQHVLGVSTWQPSELEIYQYAQVVQGAVNPMSVVDGVADDTVSMLAAQAFRDLYPRAFAQLGAEIASRAPEIQKKLDYDKQNNLSILMGVPVNSVTEPDYIKFVVTSHTRAKEDQTASMGDVDANALIQGVPTQAQQLLKRGTR